MSSKPTSLLEWPRGSASVSMSAIEARHLAERYSPLSSRFATSHAPYKLRDGPTNPGLRRRNLYERRPTENQTDKALGASRRRIEERCPLPISHELIIRLRIQTRQILFAGRFDRILTGKNITCTQPIKRVCIVIRMCRIDGHYRVCAGNSVDHKSRSERPYGASNSWRAWEAN
jgi:hypothetical protein